MVLVALTLGASACAAILGIDDVTVRGAAESDAPSDAADDGSTPKKTTSESPAAHMGTSIGPSTRTESCGSLAPLLTCENGTSRKMLTV